MTHLPHRLLSTLGVVIFLDQASKLIASQAGIVITNQGISLGLLSTDNQVLITLASLAIITALWFGLRDFWRLHPVVGGLLFGGGISNILDRVFVHGVRDWVPIPGLNITNNLADWSISLAVASIILLELREQFSSSTKKEEHGH